MFNFGIKIRQLKHFRKNPLKTRQKRVKTVKNPAFFCKKRKIYFKIKNRDEKSRYGRYSKNKKNFGFYRGRKICPFPCKKSLFFQLFFTIPFAVFIVLSAIFSLIFDFLFLSVYPLLWLVFCFFYLVFAAFTSTFSLVFSV